MLEKFFWIENCLEKKQKYIICITPNKEKIRLKNVFFTCQHNFFFIISKHFGFSQSV